jgi:hypothetical protein
MRPPLIILLSLLACDPSGVSSEPSSSAQPVITPDPQPSTTESSPIAPDLGLQMAPQPPIIDTRRVPVDVEEAEDGWGQQIPAPAPVAIEVRAERWGGRALDPVLHLGERRFMHYTHPGPGRIQFVLADERWLDDGPELAIQYGDDLRTRVELSLPRGGD